MMMYDVGYFNNTHEFLVLLAQQRGKLKKVCISFLFFFYARKQKNVVTFLLLLLFVIVMYNVG